MHPTEKTKTIEPAFLNARDAAKVIPIPHRTFMLYLQRGLIPSYRFGRFRFFKREDIIAAVESHRIAARDGSANELG